MHSGITKMSYLLIQEKKIRAYILAQAKDVEVWMETGLYS